MDGTLLNDEKIITPEVFSSIKALQDLNIKVVLATGRGFELMRPYARQLSLSTLAVLNNGSLVKDLGDGTVHYAKILNKKTQAKVLDYAFKNGDPFALFTETGFYGTDNVRMDYYQQFNHDYPDANIPLYITQNISDLLTIDAYKIFLQINDSVRFNSIYDQFKHVLDAHVTQSMDGFLDILPKGVNKAEALDVVLNYYGVDKDEVLVFGDNDNDAEMLAILPHSYAMKNGSDKAKLAAKTITHFTNNDNGVAHEINQFINTHLQQQNNLK